MKKRFELSDNIRRLIHPLLLNAAKGRIDCSIQILNSMPEVEENKIFAINHSCVLDAPISSNVIKDHFYFLVGKQSLEFIDRMFFFLNGVVYVDRKSKKNKKKSLQKMLKILEDGKSLLMCPEGTWNLTPSKPIRNRINDLEQYTKRSRFLCNACHKYDALKYVFLEDKDIR